MSWELDDQHELLRATVREFAAGEIAPFAAQWDRDHHFPVDTVRAMGDLGLFGIVFPAEYGGGEGDFTSLCVAIEEIGRVDQSMGITLSAGVGLGALAARPGRRAGARGFRAHRTRWGFRRRCDPHPCRARR